MTLSDLQGHSPIARFSNGILSTSMQRISIDLERRAFSVRYLRFFLLARLMGQYSFAGWRLLSVVVVCNAAVGQAGRPPGAWAVDTARRASTVTSRCGRHLVTCDLEIDPIKP